MKTLAALVDDLPVKSRHGDGSVLVESIAYDSRRVTKGALFVAWRGAKADGHQWINQAKQAGAVAVLGEREAEMPADLPWICVDSARRALAVVADRFYNKPSQGMTLVGVTGTNGKTTVTYLVEAIFKALGFSTGVTGTVNTRFGDTVRESAMTTQESLEFQQTLREMADAGVTHVASEISSHALALERCVAVRFDAAIYTNLTRDHLDFHATMEDYFRAKAHLFLDLLPASEKKSLAILNLDDEFGRRLKGLLRGPCLTYSRERTEADFSVRMANFSSSGIEAHLKTPCGEKIMRSSLLGAHNLSNLLAALACAQGLGLDLDAALGALSRFEYVPGRLQPVPNRQKKTVLVDYAHTPDALENVLRALRVLVPKGGRLFCLFGCGGDRDRGKRPLMASVAARLADHVYLTSDNPRTEEPQKILAEIRAGLPPHFTSFDLEADRAKAIQGAIHAIDEKDVLLIAGKGHENYQIIGVTKQPFDDVVVARQALEVI